MAVIGTGGGHDAPMKRAAPSHAEPPEADAEAAAAADDQSTGGPSGPKRDPDRIGVVFVHGIGSQRPGETLLSWAQPLLRVISSWSATTSGVPPTNDPVDTSTIDFSGGTRPSIIARVPAHGDHRAQSWVMTEAWWATRISPPSVGDMFRWLVPVEMIRIIRGILGGIARENRGYAVAEFFFLTIFLVPVTVAVLALYVLFRIFQVIPYRPLQELGLVGAIQFFLVDWFGDVRILLADRAQAANIRATVAAAIRDLEADGCGTTVLVAHSGGTLVGYMTLTDPRYFGLEVSRFITHGQALGLAWRLGHACEPSRVDRALTRLYRGDHLRTDIATARPSLRWHDFWATHDPAPAGGFSTGCAPSQPAATGGGSQRIYSRMSLRNDHGAYWDNDEEFVLPVARLIESSPAGSPDASRFFADTVEPSRSERRRSRVKLYQFAWIGLMSSAIVAIPLALLDPLLPGDQGNLTLAGQGAYDLIGRIAAPFGWLGELLKLPGFPERAEGTLALVVGLAAMLFAYWAIGHIMAGFWNTWDRRERAISLQPWPTWRSTRPLALQLGLCAAAAVALLGFAAAGSALALLFPTAAVLAAFAVRFLSPRGIIRRYRPDAGPGDGLEIIPPDPAEAPVAAT